MLILTIAMAGAADALIIMEVNNPIDGPQPGAIYAGTCNYEYLVLVEPVDVVLTQFTIPSDSTNISNITTNSVLTGGLTGFGYNGCSVFTPIGGINPLGGPDHVTLDAVQWNGVVFPGTYNFGFFSPEAPADMDAGAFTALVLNSTWATPVGITMGSNNFGPMHGPGPVPEPGTLALVGIGLASLILHRHRK